MRRTVPCSGLLALVLFVLFSSTDAKAQSMTFGNGRMELGAGVGPLFFLGDLGGNHGVGTRFTKDVNFPTVRMVKGVFAQYYIREWLGVRLAGNFGQLEGDDALVSDKGGAEVYRKNRNLHFRSKIQEAYLAFEVAPTVFLERYDGLALKLRPYAIAGVGMFHFNPQAQYFDPSGNARWVDLKPLRTEGQGMTEYPNRKEYSLTQIEIPLGFGAKYYFSDNFFVGLEFMHRKTFTDYIDDVSTNYIDPAAFDRYLTPEQSAMANQLNNRESFLPGAGVARGSVSGPGEQRGNPKQTDAFFSTILRMGWRLGDVLDSDRRALSQNRCPSYF
jgi:hypothetical protein